MLEKTISIKQHLETLGSNYEEKIKYLHNKYENEECFILGCGPSLLDYDIDYINKKLSDKLVFCIKQSQLIFPNPDFHFINDNNLIRYSLNKSTITSFSASSGRQFQLVLYCNPKYKCDIFTPIEQPVPSSALCNTLLFDNYLLKNRLLRPWGPGILTEVVFYMAVHLGVKKICTLGWDLSDSKQLQEGKHFYDGVIEKNQMVNPANITIEKDTQSKDILMSKNIKDWLYSHEIQLTTVSKKTYIDENIQRENL